MRLLLLLILNLVAAFFILSETVVNAAESCMQCHLHQSIVEDATSHEEDASTLAAFHVREFGGEDPISTCSKCHEGRQSEGKLPTPDVCKQCHTKGKTTQGNPANAFHAEKNHWPMKKVLCINCHKGHSIGNSDIKFLTPAVTGMCSVCHEKTFGGNAPMLIK